MRRTYVSKKQTMTRCALSVLGSSIFGAVLIVSPLVCHATTPQQPRFLVPPLVPTDQSPRQVAAADFNHDGKLDLAVTTEKGVDILLGYGAGNFKPYRSYHFHTVQLGGAIAVGDFNNDGNLDLVMLPTRTKVRILLGNGDGTFREGGYFSVSEEATDVAVGDFNGDGNLDVVVSHSCCTAMVGVMLGNGDGSLQPEQHYGGGRAYSVVVADFNGDGKLDIASNGDQTLQVLFGNGDGTFQSRISLGAAGPQLGLADVNSDGLIDIVTRIGTSQSGGFVVVF